MGSFVLSASFVLLDEVVRVVLSLGANHALSAPLIAKLAVRLLRNTVQKPPHFWRKMQCRGGFLRTMSKRGASTLSCHALRTQHM
eukprot:1052415-Rhodomonas_salina.2